MAKSQSKQRQISWHELPKGEGTESFRKINMQYAASRKMKNGTQIAQIFRIQNLRWRSACFANICEICVQIFIFRAVV